MKRFFALLVTAALLAVFVLPLVSPQHPKAASGDGYTHYTYLQADSGFKVSDNGTVITPTYFKPNAEIWPESVVDLTSPTKTFSVAGKRLIVLSSDQNQTAICPTGGVVGQVITIRGADSGNNTMTFSDGTSTVLAGNVVLTEGANSDTITLLCIDADGDEWAGLSSSVN